MLITNNTFKKDICWITYSDEDASFSVLVVILKAQEGHTVTTGSDPKIGCGVGIGTPAKKTAND